MCKCREILVRNTRILELRGLGMSTREIGRAVGLSGVAVHKILQAPPERQISSADMVFPGSEFADEEAQFLKAVAAYQQANGRKFMRATDYLAVLKTLGYRR